MLISESYKKFSQKFASLHHEASVGLNFPYWIVSLKRAFIIVEHW